MPSAESKSSVAEFGGLRVAVGAAISDLERIARKSGPEG